MLNWMIAHGFVRDDVDSYLKTKQITEGKFEDLLKTTGISLKAKRERQRTVDDVLYKAFLRLIIKKNHVSENMLQDAFAIASVSAISVIDRMDIDGYIVGFKDLRREILITKEKFKELYGEEI